MSKQSNSLFKAAWKWPLLKEQLIELNQQLLSCLESKAESKQLLPIAGGYQQVYSKLTSINLMDFATLTELLMVALVNVAERDQLAEQEPKTDSLLALTEVSDILQQQFQSLCDQGTYDSELIAETVQQLQALFGLIGFDNSGTNNLLQGNSHLVNNTQEQDRDKVVISLSQRTDSIVDPIQSLAIRKAEAPEQAVAEQKKQMISQLPSTATRKAKVEPETVEQNQAKPEQSKTGVKTEEVGVDSPSSGSLLQSARQQVQLAADDQHCDEEIKAIFIEEANEVLQTVSSHFSQLTFLTDNPKLLSEIRRGFHTLKGSGRMAGAHSTADLAAAVEAMLNRILEGTLSASYGMQRLLGEVIEHYPSLIQCFEQQVDYPDFIKLWMAAAQLYTNNKASDTNSKK